MAEIIKFQVIPVYLILIKAGSLIERKVMKNIIFTTLLVLGFSSITSANGDFRLTRAAISDSNISKNMGVQANDFNSCSDYCEDDYVYCHASGEDDRVCAIDFSECLMDCYYDNL